MAFQPLKNNRYIKYFRMFLTKPIHYIKTKKKEHLIDTPKNETFFFENTKKRK